MLNWAFQVWTRLFEVYHILYEYVFAKRRGENECYGRYNTYFVCVCMCVDEYITTYLPTRVYIISFYE